MLKKIHQEISRIKGSGATYVDARWYPFEEVNYLMMWNGNLKTTASSHESGIGIRVLYKGAWGFSACIRPTTRRKRRERRRRRLRYSLP